MNEDNTPNSKQGIIEKGISTLQKNMPTWRRYINKIIAAEVSRISRYYDRVIQWKPRRGDSGALLDAIDNQKKTVANSLNEVPEMQTEKDERSLLLLNGNVNHSYDIQGMLMELHAKLSRSSRLVLVAYNPYYRWLYRIANQLGLRSGEQPDTFVTQTDLYNLAEISGYSVVRIRPTAYCPFALFGIGTLINRVMPIIPLFRWLSLTAVITLRPIKTADNPSLSIVIPARNERDNIENALKRMPSFATSDIEIIFVEGHSSDGTWEEIQRVVAEYGDRFSLSAYQQTGKGKSDAVRLGFSKASKDLLTILDADLTMPPELLNRFYDAYTEGRADFINGSRLMYPMEGQAMRFLNRLGNIFFAKALSFVLDTRLGDSLCGTKLLSRSDYDRFIKWRDDFGDVDPFGDFELLFPAASLALGVVDIPIRYRDRTYGSTNISRFSHGAMLFKMTFIGLIKLKLGSAGGRRKDF